MANNGNIRLGPVKVALGGVGCLGMILIGLALYIGSALAWGFVFMLIHGAAVHAGTPGYWTQSWGYWHSVIPWGLVAPFVLG